MKTIKFRLLATIITLAAVLAATNTSEAQRRNESSANETQKTRQDRKSSVSEKNNSRNNAYEKEAEVRKVNSKREVTRNQKSQAENLKSSGNHQEYSRAQSNKKENKRESRDRSDVNRNKDSRPASKQMIQSDREYIPGNTERVKNESRSSERTRYSNSDNRDQNNNAYTNNERAGRTSGVTNREKYRLDNDEERYRPNKNFRGSDKYWSAEIRDNHHNHGKKVKKGHYNHWDHNWEHYRWNANSWRNYYSYYDPYSYRNYRYYYHHPHYGHVIRKFSAPPMIFIHNHHKYYCYDGHFFSYRPGIGYILVDVPFGVTFAVIPDNYDTVYINGYMYYRVGNLFMEYTPAGYQLVHYPERYYAYDDHYINGGISFEFSIN